jgi:23S rRNA pseudouridine1911/1915/1917 synthase
VSEHDWEVAATEVGLRLDKFLAHSSRLGSRGRAIWALERGKVFVNDADVAPADAARRLAPGDRVRLWLDRPGSARPHVRRPTTLDGGLRILYEDDAIIVVNKPPGLLSVPLPEKEGAPSVQSALAEHLPPRSKRRPFVVHRIDRDTSGLVLFATRPDAQQQLKNQFRRHEPLRVYLAFVYGTPDPAAGTWRDHLVWDDDRLIQKATHARDPRGRESRSDYRVIESFGATALIEVRLVTGKRNQIRLQARLRGHTLIGEQRYTYGPDELRPIDFPRQALHAHQLTIAHPVSGEPMHFEAPLPDDLKGLWRRLRSVSERSTDPLLTSQKLRQSPKKIS